MSSSINGPLARIQSGGIGTASIVDLVSVGFARRESDVNDNVSDAVDFVSKFGSINRFADLTYSDVKDFGLEGFENLKCLSLVELGRRAGVAKFGEKTKIETANDAIDVLRRKYVGQKKEHFVVVLLDAKNVVIRSAEVHVGTLTMSPVGPREVFREAIRDGASAVIVAHNHPSGDPTPSPEDRLVTERLRQVGELLDIPVLDHFVLGERYAVSVLTGKRVGG